ncbi:MAG: hypothetical protein V4736_04895 [Bdellovibrionota bacterium]
MKTNNLSTAEMTVTTDSVDSSMTALTMKHYYELEDQAVQEVSDIRQLQMQMEQLQNLHMRSRFMVREIAYLMKVD